MTKIADLKLGGKTFQLSIGPSGSGKTVSSGTYPRPILFIDLDQRIEPIKKMFPKNNEGMEFERYGPYDFLRLWNRINDLRSGNAPHKTYVLSSLISLARIVLNYSVGLRGSGGGRKDYKKLGVIDLLEIEDFGAEARLLGHVIDAFRSLNSNFILEAHLVRVTEKDIKTKTETEYKSLLTGGKKIAEEIPSYFNEVYYFFTRNKVDAGGDRGVDYYISTVPKDDILCKTALPISSEIKVTMEPDGPGLYQIIQKECKEKGVEIG